MVLDSGLSQLPMIVGSLMNTATQTAIGWSKQDTALFIARDKLAYNWDKSDWTGIGQGFMLGLSQILKYESPPASVAVAPTAK